MEMQGKVPLVIRPGFWLASALLGWLATSDIKLTLIWVSVILISVLVHELGHALAYLLFGKQSIIELNLLGGATIPVHTGERQCPLKTWQTLLVEVAGPCGGLLLVALSAILGGTLNGIVLAEGATLWMYTLNLFLALNVLWSIANLLPVLPLDGGHVMRTIITAIWGPGSVRWAFLMSVVFGLAGAVITFVMGYVLATLLFGLLAVQNGVAWWSSRDFVEGDLDDELREELEQAFEEVISKQYPAAQEHFKDVIQRAPGGMLSLVAQEQLAELEHRQGHLEAAYALLNPSVPKLSAEALILFHEIACTLQHWDQVVAVGDMCFREAPNEMVALRNSLAYAMLKRPLESMHWFEASWENGLPEPSQALQRPEYEAIRSSPEFQHVKEMLARSA